jgi:protein-S-isoprenylcysteine O-methyltransferase Ste14
MREKQTATFAEKRRPMDASSESRTTAGITIFPPALFAVAVGAGVALGRGAALDARSASLASTVGAASIAGGVGIVLAGALTIVRHGSNVRVDRAATTLVTSGPFAATRNPMYVGLTALAVGVGLRTRSLPALAFVPIALALLDSRVVAREERYLEARFGERYRAYHARVPRWF